MKAICQEKVLGAIVAQWICKASKDRTLSVGFGFQVLGFGHDHGILGKYQLVEVVEAFKGSANPPRRPQKSTGNRTEPISAARQFWRSAMTCQVLVVVVEDAKSKAHPSHSSHSIFPREFTSRVILKNIQEEGGQEFEHSSFFSTALFKCTTLLFRPKVEGRKRAPNCATC